jgi:hypothetical protein
MRMETKFLRLRTPVELGSLFGEWSVCWLGGWAKHRLYYLVMLVRIVGYTKRGERKRRRACRLGGIEVVKCYLADRR